MPILYNRILWLWLGSFVLFIVTLAAVFFKIHNAPETIALHYNIIVGVNEVGNKYELLKLPATGLLIGIINFALARIQKFDKTFLPFLASLVTVIANTVLLIAALFLFRVS